MARLPVLLAAVLVASGERGRVFGSATPEPAPRPRLCRSASLQTSSSSSGRLTGALNSTCIAAVGMKKRDGRCRCGAERGTLSVGPAQLPRSGCTFCLARLRTRLRRVRASLASRRVAGGGRRPAQVWLYCWQSLSPCRHGGTSPAWRNIPSDAWACPLALPQPRRRALPQNRSLPCR